jgi:hypothetical protein
MAGVDKLDMPFSWELKIHDLTALTRQCHCLAVQLEFDAARISNEEIEIPGAFQLDVVTRIKSVLLGLLVVDDNLQPSFFDGVDRQPIFSGGYRRRRRSG